MPRPARWRPGGVPSSCFLYQGGESQHGFRGSLRPQGGLSGPAGHTQSEQPTLRAGVVGGADSAHPGPSRREHGPWGGPSSWPREEEATIVPSISSGKLRPREKQCFVQGHAEGLEARSPAPGRVPASRPAPASLPGCCSGETQHTHSAQTGKAWLAARSRPTLMTAAQVAVASGSGSELLAARRVPEPRATASSPRSLAGGAGGRGRSPAQAPPAHPSFFTPPTALLAPRGWSRGVHTRREQAHTPARVRRSDWGVLPGDQAAAGTVRPAWLHVLPVPRCVARDKGLDLPEPPFSPW